MVAGETDQDLDEAAGGRSANQATDWRSLTHELEQRAAILLVDS